MKDNLTTRDEIIDYYNSRLAISQCMNLLNSTKNGKLSDEEFMLHLKAFQEQHAIRFADMCLNNRKYIKRTSLDKLFNKHIDVIYKEYLEWLNYREENSWLYD